MNKETFNKWFNVFILAGMTISIVIATALKLNAAETSKMMLLFAAFGSLMGVASTVLAANGIVWTFVFGLIDVLVYSYALFESQMTSQLLLHLLYFLPMEFVGFFQWRKRGASSKEKVKARRLHGRQWLWVALLFVAVMAVTTLISQFGAARSGAETNLPKVLLDAAIATSNIVAIILMSMAYMEQWFLWTLVNVNSVVLWSITLASDPGSSYALVYVVKYVFYFINGINGIRIWLDLSEGSGLEN